MPTITRRIIERERTRISLIRFPQLVGSIVRIESVSQDFNPRSCTLAELDAAEFYGFFHYFFRHKPFIEDRSVQFNNDRRAMNPQMQANLIELIHTLTPGAGVDVNRSGRGITIVELGVLDRPTEEDDLRQTLLLFRVLRQVHVSDLRHPQWRADGLVRDSANADGSNPPAPAA